ncbi:MAG: protein-L-isoaspartate(D-aspartate) O-methyltransferase [Deltaproteobacteria bacterium]|nr:protein-L-isoaspartate(D-aspartate) O-methyltransferase [Deltaproteobacteria bacterium]
MADIDTLIHDIEVGVRETRTHLGTSTLDARVLSAMRRVPRAFFVPGDAKVRAYDDTALPIAEGQTISQPYIVAVMTHVLELQPEDRVLEIGTGSGYQTAILAELVCQVHTIELSAELSTGAQHRLAALGYDQNRILFRVADGYLGWPEAAPFSKIMVTAAGPDIPPPLLAQLSAGGRMVLPIESAPGRQVLTLVTVDLDGRLAERPFLPVAFVPLRRA